MCGGWNQVYIMFSIIVRDVIVMDGCQIGVFVLGICIGLQGDSVIVGEFG